jgi:Flp pilus assembly protein TadB
MSPIFTLGLVLALAAAFVSWISRTRRPDADAALSAFDAVSAQGPITAGIARIARPVAGTKAVAELSRTSMLRPISDNLKATGMYGSDLSVFIAYQIAAVFIGTMLCALALAAGQSGILRLTFGLIGVAVAGWPYNQVTQAAKKSAAAAEEQLPDFAELLQMSLVTGMSVNAALEFTASQFQDGPVAREVRWLLDTLTLRSMGTEDAYREAGLRIGSAEAVAFFNALGQAELGGTKVVESIGRQAESLRLKAHQNRRAEIKKIPVKLVIAFAVHFLPLIFVVTMLPLVSSLGNL